MSLRLLVPGLAALAAGCGPSGRSAVPSSVPPSTLAGYFDTTGHADVGDTGVRMIPIRTEKGMFRVWTRRVGNDPRIEVLLLHGGPGAMHEYLEIFGSHLPVAGIEYYESDQLGSLYSDQPNDPSLWQVPRFVDEVEQVRLALGLDHDDFVLVGHSWGGILAMEYALAHQDHLKGLVISHRCRAFPRTTRMPARRSCRRWTPRRWPRSRRSRRAATTRARATWSSSSPTFYVEHFLGRPVRPVAGSGAARLQLHQPEARCAHAGAERDGGERSARALGQDGRPAGNPPFRGVMAFLNDLEAGRL